jgi:hypothetical protein
MADLRETNLVDTNSMRACLLLSRFGIGFNWASAQFRRYPPRRRNPGSSRVRDRPFRFRPPDLSLDVPYSV